jgi:NAD(P)-dependent dehydrogenase (short-subunit alcohol dehydrogenase family)
MDLGLQDKHVLVTGGSKGIGRAVASMFLREECHVTIVGRDRAALDAALASVPSPQRGRCRAIAADLSNEEGRAEVERHAGEVDILVNNAGAIPPGALADVDSKAWRQGWELKVFGYIEMCRRYYGLMARRRGGVIVNIIGVSGERVDPNYIAGSSGNASLIAFTRALGKAAPRDGLRVVGINPGPVDTDRLERMRRHKAEKLWGDAERFREQYGQMPFGRPARVDEIAAAAVFLASPLSGYTTGAILRIDGGANA